MKIRIRWSDFGYNEPIKIIITDWDNLKTFLFGQYMLVDSMLEYKGHMIELCVPYKRFVYCLRGLPVEQQRLVIKNKGIIEIMKVPYHNKGGMVINSVTELK